MSNNKVLVTGAGGFIGANLVRLLLKRGYDVHALVRKDTNLWRLEDLKAKLKIHRGDLLDLKWLEKKLRAIRPSYIFNLAQNGGYPFQKDAEKIWETNLVGTVNLLEAAITVGFKKFIQTGSSSEYGKKEKPMSEDDTLRPEDSYGLSKAAASLYCERRGRDGKLPIVVLRLFSIYGPWEEPTRLIPTIVGNYLKGKSLKLSSPEVARDFVHIDDVLKAFMTAMKRSGANGKIINIASGKQTTLKKVADAMSKIARKKVPVEWQRAVGRSFDTTKWVGNASRAKKVLGWRAGISFENGLKKTIMWFKQNKKHYDNR